jgi:hypothetical protein
MESGPVPTHHRFRRDHNEGLLPSDQNRRTATLKSLSSRLILAEDADGCPGCTELFTPLNFRMRYH